MGPDPCPKAVPARADTARPQPTSSHTTWASVRFQPLSHTVPHVLLWRTSTLPEQELEPFTSLVRAKPGVGAPASARGQQTERNFAGRIIAGHAQEQGVPSLTPAGTQCTILGRGLGSETAWELQKLWRTVEGPTLPLAGGRFCSEWRVLVASGHRDTLGLRAGSCPHCAVRRHPAHGRGQPVNKGITNQQQRPSSQQGIDHQSTRRDAQSKGVATRQQELATSQEEMTSKRQLLNKGQPINSKEQVSAGSHSGQPQRLTRAAAGAGASPEQMTLASSPWAQLFSPQGLAGHWERVSSAPPQRTLSSQMGPSPRP